MLIDSIRSEDPGWQDLVKDGRKRRRDFLYVATRPDPDDLFRELALRQIAAQQNLGCGMGAMNYMPAYGGIIGGLFGGIL